MLVTDRGVEREAERGDRRGHRSTGLLGAHPRIQNRSMRLAIDELLGAPRPVRAASSAGASARSGS